MAAVAEELPTTASVEKKKETPAKKIFGKQKSADLIIYRLIKKNDKIREDTPEYPPYIRFPNYDLIVWEGGSRAIRFLPGETSIFVDEQEKNGRVLPDNIINNPNNRFEIINGIIRVRPHEKLKLQFLDICNRNANSEHKTGTIQSLFARVSEEKTIEDLQAKQKAQKEAIEKAFGASDEQMLFHAKYLGIPLIDNATSASRSEEAIVTDYREVAINEPVKFLKTFDDEDLKLKYKIEKAIEDNKISLTLIPTRAVFVSDKYEICDVPTGELKYVVDAIFNFVNGKSGTGALKKISDFDK